MATKSDEPEDETAVTGERSIGLRLRLARKRANMSQEYAGSVIGVTERSIGRWELDEVAPSFEDVAKLADLYSVSMDWFAARTSILSVLKPGHVIVDEAAQEVMSSLVAAGGTLRDVPEHLVRHPGIDYAFTVPQRCLVMSPDAALAVDRNIQRMLNQLKGKKS